MPERSGGREACRCATPRLVAHHGLPPRLLRARPALLQASTAAGACRPRDRPLRRDEPGRVSMSRVRHLAGRNAYLQPVLLWRQRAGRIRVEGAGWVVGLVEIEDRCAVAAQVRVQEPRRLVGLLAARPVPEDEIEPPGSG